MDNSTIELVTFKTKAGITHEQLEVVASNLADFLKVQPGFLYRSLSSDEDGLWHDIVYWKTMDDAKNANEKFMQLPAGIAIMETIDPESVRMRHMNAINEVMGE